MMITSITKLLGAIGSLIKEQCPRKGGAAMREKVEMDFPQITIKADPYRRLQRYIDLCPVEIAGLGKMHQINNVIEIYEIFTLPQVATLGSAEIEPDAVAEYLTKMAAADEPTEDLVVWWHSHGNGECWWSGIDTAMANTFQAEMLVGILGNRQHKFTCRVDVYKPLRVKITGLPLICPELEDFDAEILAEIQRNLRHLYGSRKL